MRRQGLNTLTALEPTASVRSYEREAGRTDPYRYQEAQTLRTGRSRHDQDGQKGRSIGPGWEFVHVAIDDHSRIAFARIIPNEKKRSATAFLTAALAYYASLDITVVRMMSDNGSCYRSFAFRRA
jgi:transposase InsO family protein